MGWIGKLIVYSIGGAILLICTVITIVRIIAIFSLGYSPG